MMKIKKITFEDVLPIWQTQLWPGRKDIKPMSSMVFLGGYNMSIYNYVPTYWGIFKNGKLIGVNSGFRTDSNVYRSRGLYVFPEYRNQGLSKILLSATIDQGVEEGCNLIWSLPRKDALYAYEAVGFVKCSDWLSENMVSGPNCYVKKDI